MPLAKSQDDPIAEKKLGIPPDYQYKAIRGKNYLQTRAEKAFIIKEEFLSLYFFSA